jgi:hypothetical protein
VSGASPVVDTQNVKQQAVVSTELLAALPSGAHGTMGIARLVPGMSGGTDSGGAQGLRTANNAVATTVHGKANGKVAFDGMQIDDLAIAGNLAYIVNPGYVEETVVETGGISAESETSGIRMNLIPKEGGNAFRFGADSTYTNHLGWTERRYLGARSTDFPQLDSTRPLPLRVEFVPAPNRQA